MVRQKGQSGPPPGEGDISVLRQPISLSMSGTRQVIEAVRSGTAEVQQVLLEECDIIFECKVCKNLFRGLPNVLAHKRVYCKETYAEKEVFAKQLTDAMIHSQQAETIVVQPAAPPRSPSPDPLQSDPEEDPWNNQYPDEVPPPIKPKVDDNNEKAKPKSNKTDIASVVDKLKQGTFEGQSPDYQFYTAATALSEIKQEKKTVSEVQLSSMAGTSCAVAQKVSELREEVNTGSEGESVIEEPKQTKKKGHKRKRSVADSNDTASESSGEPLRASEYVVVEPVEAKGPLRMCLRERTADQALAPTAYEKLLKNPKCDVQKLVCLICSTNYRSVKTLFFHMTTFHSEKRTFYPCMYCGSIFAQLYSVTRHLIKTHGKTKVQVEKMREKLKRKAFTRLVDEFGSETYPVDENEEMSADQVKMEDEEGLTEAGVSGMGRGLTLQRCQICPKAFATKESLDAHMERAHDDESSQLPENSASASTICTRRSSRQAEKQVDQSINMIKIIRRDPLEHEDPSILQGISASELRKMASFIDETAKKCLKCRKRYGSLSNLQRHAVRHLGWRRFKCKMCRYTAYNRSECRTHIRKVHAYKVNNLHNYDLAKFIIELEDDTVDMQRTRVPRVDVSSRSKSAPDPYDRFPTFTSAFKYYNISTRKNARRVAPLSQDLQTLRTRSGVYTKPSFEELTGRGKQSEESNSEEEEEEEMEEGEEENEGQSEMKEGEEGEGSPFCVSESEEEEKNNLISDPSYHATDQETKEFVKDSECDSKSPTPATELESKTSSHNSDPGSRSLSHSPEPDSRSLSHTPDPGSRSLSHTPDPGSRSLSHTPDPGSRSSFHDMESSVKSPREALKVESQNTDQDSDPCSKDHVQPGEPETSNPGPSSEARSESPGQGADTATMATGEESPGVSPQSAPGEQLAGNVPHPPQSGSIALGITVQSVDKAVTNVVSALQQQANMPQRTKSPPNTVSGSVTRCRPIILSQQNRVKIIPAGVPIRPIVVTSSQLQRIMDMKKKARALSSPSMSASDTPEGSSTLSTITTSQGSLPKVVKIPGVFVTSVQSGVSRASPVLSLVSTPTACTLASSSSVATETADQPVHAPHTPSADSDVSSPKVEVSLAEEEGESSHQSSDGSGSGASVAEHRLTECCGVGVGSPQVEVSISVQGIDTESHFVNNTGVNSHSGGEQTVTQLSTRIRASLTDDSKEATGVKTVEATDMPQLAPIPTLSSANGQTPDTTEMPKLSLATEPQKGSSKVAVPTELSLSTSVLPPGDLPVLPPGDLPVLPPGDPPVVQDSTPMTPDSLGPLDTALPESDIDQHSDSSYCSETVNPAPGTDPVVSEGRTSPCQCSFIDMVKESGSPLALLQTDLDSPAPSPQAGISPLLPLGMGVMNADRDRQGAGDGAFNTKPDPDMIKVKEGVSSGSSGDILDFIDRTESGISADTSDPMRFINS